jgi:apolipoprotein N-acyltransferase
MLLPFASALLLWASFHPLDLGVLAFAGLVPLAVYARAETKGWRAFLMAWAGGWLFHATSFIWLRHVFPAGSLLLAIYMGIFWAILVVLVRGLRRWPPALALPIAWVTCEFTWSYFLGGLPYYQLGTTQHHALALIQIADLGGVWLVSALIASVNGAVAGAFFTPTAEPAWRSRVFRVSIVTVGALVVLSVLYGAIRLATLPLEEGAVVAVIQPNIPQDAREVAKGASDEQARAIWEKHVALTRQAMKLDPRPVLVCWPESAIFTYPTYDAMTKTWDAGTVSGLFDVAAEAGVPIIVGALVRERVAPGGRYRGDCPKCGASRPMEEGPTRCEACGVWMRVGIEISNSALLISPAREVIGRYDKSHLVAFSEQMPFPWVGPIVASYLKIKKVFEFRPGTSWQPWSVAGTTMGPQVCYEAAYPDISRIFARNGARACVNLSNEGWFRDGAELDQMLAMGRLRAVESRVLYLRATNTGVSAFIEPTGRIAAVLEVAGKRKQVEGVLAARMRTTPSGSVFRSVGDVIPWSFAAAALLGWIVGRFVDRSKGQK